jgi:serine/threonine protein phosphatase PrpC
VRNLKDHPEETKYHSMRFSNVHFQERMGRLEGGMEAMAAIGYDRVPECDLLKYTPSSDMTADERAQELTTFHMIISERLDEAEKQIALLPVRITNTHVYKTIRGCGWHGFIGRRHDMEDDEIVVDPFNGSQNSTFFGLYDGHGGRDTVDFVVKALHCNMERYLQLDPKQDMREAFRVAYRETDSQVRRQNLLQSGTTSVTAVITQDEKSGKRVLHTANAGDSRAILCRNGKGIRLTIDHKPTLDEERKRINAADGFVANGRVNGMLAVSRALGDHLLKPNEVVSPDPFYAETPLLEAGDSHLILACDGVWDVMTDQQACEFVEEQSAQQTDTNINQRMQNIAKALVEYAYNLHSMDNITVMVIKL